MSWRVMLTLVLLAGAIVSGWSVWRQNAGHAATATTGGRSDYVLHDFELVALDGTTGKEAFTLRAPTLQRNPGDRTMALTTPLFLVPDDAGHYWEVRSLTGWVYAEGNEVRLRGDVRAARQLGYRSFYDQGLGHRHGVTRDKMMRQRRRVRVDEFAHLARDY
jgi:lipopolysaccharide export system protein LptC